MLLRMAFMAAVALPAIAAQAVAADGLEVYFISNGETTWERAGILEGSVPDTVLTPVGARMAEETAKGMSSAGIAFDRIYTSPYLRACHTAEIVASGVGAPRPVVDSRLRDVCFGRYEGVRSDGGAYQDDNLRSFFEEPARYAPQGIEAESADRVCARLRSFLVGEIKPLEGKARRILCVAHPSVLNALPMAVAGGHFQQPGKRNPWRNCAAHVLRCKDGRFSIAETGRTFYSPDCFAFAAEPKMVAHRGAGDLTMPEASLPAFSNAVATACDIVKLDLRRTKDGVIVLGHDATLKRVMGWDAEISSLDYGEIFEKGRYLERGKPGEPRQPGESRIVRLDEALAVLKPAPELWLDFKNYSPYIAERVVAEVDNAGFDRSRVMVATFSKNALAYFRDHYPEIRRVGHVLFPKGNGDNSEIRKKVMRLRDDYGLYGLNMPVTDGETLPEDVSFLKESGLWVALWYVQNPKVAAQYLPLSPDAFVTDHVSAARQAVYKK